MLSNSYRVARVEQTLRRFEDDLPMLERRVKDLSQEQQQSARQFAAALIRQTRDELSRLHEEILRGGAEVHEAGFESGN
jgi:ElaB/YqjD/DUF883 family membrane-anchored ribosome-binding protein